MLWSLLLLLTPARAAEPHGDYVFAGGQPERDATAKVLEETVQSFSWVLRSTVRPPLERAMAVPESVSVTRVGDELTVRLGDKTFRCGVGETRPDPEGGTIACAVDGDQLTVRRAGDNGWRATVLTPTGSNLKVRTTLHSPRVDKDPVWTLTYRRQE